MDKKLKCPGTAEGALKSKSWRKQTSFKIKFPAQIQVERSWFWSRISHRALLPIVKLKLYYAHTNFEVQRSSKYLKFLRHNIWASLIMTSRSPMAMLMLNYSKRLPIQSWASDDGKWWQIEHSRLSALSSQLLMTWLFPNYENYMGPGLDCSQSLF